MYYINVPAKELDTLSTSPYGIDCYRTQISSITLYISFKKQN